MTVDEIRTIQPILTAIEVVSNRYAEAANKASGTEHLIYAEICDAFQALRAAAWKYLNSHGVKAKILNIRYGPQDGHTVVVFEQGPKRLSIYDHDGVLIFDKNCNWDTHPKIMAKAWAREMQPNKKAIDGKWIE